MIPLRYVDLSTVDVPPPPKRGVPMAIERAILLILLDPELKYLPIDIARIANEFQSAEVSEHARHRMIANDRRGYSELAQANGHVTNPQLSGAEWARLVRASLGAIVRLMSDLHDAMKAQPGVVFALSEGKIVPYVNQAYKLEPLRPLSRRYRRKHQAVVSPTPTPESTKAPVVHATIEKTSSPVELKPMETKDKPSRFRRVLMRYGWLSGALLCLFWLGDAALSLRETVSSGQYAFPVPKQVNRIAPTLLTTANPWQQADRLPERGEKAKPVHVEPIREVMVDDPVIRIMRAYGHVERTPYGVTHYDLINATSGPDLRNIKVNLDDVED